MQFENLYFPGEPRNIPKNFVLTAAEDNRSILSGTEIKNVWSYTYVPTCLCVIMLY